MGGVVITESQKIQARALHRQGKTCRAIADEVGISHGAAWNIVSHDNIKIRADVIPARCSVKHAVPVITDKTKITIHKTQIPDYAPICATTTKGFYKSNDLDYRGRKPISRA